VQDFNEKAHIFAQIGETWDQNAQSIFVNYRLEEQNAHFFTKSNKN